MFECNRSCNCNKVCGNRVVQKGAREGLQVFDTVSVCVYKYVCMTVCFQMQIQGVPLYWN